MNEVWQAPNTPWQYLARALLVTAEHSDQSSRNLRANYLMGMAWRLYNAMCDQRWSEEDFAPPPRDVSGIVAWCEELLK